MSVVATVFRPCLWLFAGAGFAALGLGAMLAVPLTRPAPLASVRAGAARIDDTGKPELSRFQARDGTWLAYRLYPAAAGRVAILAHGSSASSDEMNVLAKALAAAGETAVAIDARGHGASGGRGDIGYVGQLDDDLADLVAHLRKSYPDARLELIGHSLGGGFAARVAGAPVGRNFDRFVLLSPFLGAQAPTNKPQFGHWAEVDLPRILALGLLQRIGITLGQSLPVIAYANDPAAAKFVTSIYSFRLLAGYGPDFDWAKTAAAIRSAGSRLRVIAGAEDEMMDAPAYVRELEPLGAAVTIVPGVDHMGIVYQPAAIQRIVESATED